MKRINTYILEKLKVSNKPSKLDAQTFFDALFNYCKSNGVDGVTALDVYTDFNDIPEIIVERHHARKRTNFALHPTGQTEIVNIEIWLYTESNEPDKLLTNRKANDATFDFLVEVMLGAKVINDVYNYIEQ